MKRILSNTENTKPKTPNKNQTNMRKNILKQFYWNDTSIISKKESLMPRHLTFYIEKKGAGRNVQVRLKMQHP